MKIYLLALSLLSLTACITPGEMTKDGFQHDSVAYKIDYQDKEEKRFLPKSWKNERTKSGALPAKYQDSSSINAESFDGTPLRIFYNRYDLVFNHKETNGRITVQSYPLEPELSGKKLKILLENQASNLSGQYFSTRDDVNPRKIVSKNWVTKIDNVKEQTINGHEYLEATLELANVDQLKIDPEHRDRKYKILLIRPKKKNSWKVERVFGVSKKTYTYFAPTIISVIYSMDYSYYNDYLSEFESFTKQLQF